MRYKALCYHKKHPGKIGISILTECKNKEELSLAYTPGVAYPCQEIEKNKEKVFQYTFKGNTVAVITDGTAVLGLGNIGPKAALPVMEGKALLFKRFANIDAFPICIGTTDTKRIIETIKNISEGFGGINLEDISAPRCFEIENKLIEILDIPVFHDDQHGTAIVSMAGIINALKITRKNLDECKIVFNGAGAAGIACARLMVEMGARRENIYMCDSKGLIIKKRKDINKYKRFFAKNLPPMSLEEVIEGADIFIGLSKGNILTSKMLKSMARDPIIFAMANPIPEIYPSKAKKTRKDAIIATGRSDYPNQVNNVLGFPGIFRGALDIRAKKITLNMKINAAKAIASLIDKKELSSEYIIPSPFDKRVVPVVAKAVATAGIEDNVARRIFNTKRYMPLR